MVNVHKRLDVPLGVPMNILHLRFTLDAPLPRGRVLTLHPVGEQESWNGLMVTSRFAVEVELEGRAVARGEVRAQAMAKEMYELQRAPSSRAV